jgi:hypothetical protein
MIASTTASTIASVDSQTVRWELENALNGNEHDLGAWMDATGPQRHMAATHLKGVGDLDGYFELRLWESVAELEAGRVERAFAAAREVWVAVDGRVPSPAQALVLSQLAACSKARGDFRGAIRAARRAEALLVAGTGDATPAVLAVRAWLWRCLEAHGQNTDGVRARLDRTVAAMQDSMSDGMRGTFLENDAPPHWALVHLLRWRCIERHAS